VTQRRAVLRAVGPAAEARTRWRRLATAGAAVVLAAVLVALSHQYAKTYALAREEARLEQRRRELIADNARLREEIERLQSDDRYIEDIARRQLGLVRAGEVELLIVPYEGTVAPPGTARGRAAPASTVVRVHAPAPDRQAGTAPSSRPRRGLREWAIGVRDAVWRLLSGFP
jgi:cell division protein FtsB